MPPRCDWIFFNSPKGLTLFIECFGKPNGKVAVMGQGTYMAALTNKLEVDFLPINSDPQSAVREFASKMSNGEKVLIPRGKKSLKRLQQILTKERYSDFVFYDTFPKKEIPKAKEELLVFTSPSNADAYFENHGLIPNQKVVAIGRTTAESLQNAGIIVDAIADEPNEKSIWKAIGDLYLF